jgi:hypothetical protein
MNEALWVPENQLQYVVQVIELGLSSEGCDVPKSTRKNLTNWCKEMKSYLKRMEEDNE